MSTAEAVTEAVMATPAGRRILAQQRWRKAKHGTRAAMRWKLRVETSERERERERVETSEPRRSELLQ